MALQRVLFHSFTLREYRNPKVKNTVCANSTKCSQLLFLVFIEDDYSKLVKTLRPIQELDSDLVPYWAIPIGFCLLFVDMSLIILLIM